ncbi:sushi domain-containing protein 2-like [Mizuhopecten yessoensis]|uniref:Extracellular domains-containing protein n=1 Tax=Mizuhopecten yessoensis TaxID=6573 RepID=A0A210Q2Z9_MIZYE|nr:sushi domain-containing protein 2-like [Mizuhopecten yessoensis]OWF43039.1 Extracellular domains-containing protein [Mizuhopecten yessoensis]
MCSNVRSCHWYSIGILLVTFALTCCPVSSHVSLVELYPSGELNGDTANKQDDDGGSDKIFLTVNFPFYGQDYTSLYVNNNGLLTFEKEKKSYKPEKFPLNDNTSVIAIFWADIDTQREGGNVTYRQTTDPLLLTRATEEVRKYFFLRKEFTWMLIATWFEVGFYGASNTGELRKNTFQLVLATNEEESFAFYLYKKLQWTTGSNSRGNSSTGLGGNPAQVGFNSEDGVSYLSVDGAQTDAVINLTRTSNVDVPGTWIFGVSGTEIRDVQCSHDVQIQIVPTNGNMLGGEEFRVTGPCFQSDYNVTARIVQTNSTFQCAVINFLSAKCVLPPIFKTGEVTLELNPYGISWNYSTVLQINNVASMAPKVVRKQINQWIIGNKVKVDWNSTSLPSSQQLTVELMGYQYNNGDPNFTAVKPLDIDETLDSFILPASLTSFQAAAVRVREKYPAPGSVPVAVWSDVFPVRVGANWSSLMCATWNATDNLLPSISSSNLSCPCIARQALRDTGRFTFDPFCSSDNSNRSTNCVYKPGAVQCFLRIQKSESSTGASCCYDESGDLIDIRDSNGGGSSLRYTIRSQGHDAVPFFSFFEEELLSSLHCCQYSNAVDMCQLFKEKRPPVTCDQYDPPTAAQAVGDPHLTTLDGQDFTFNGLGDFILVEDDASSVVVEVRTAQAQDTEGHYQNASIFSGVAMTTKGVSDVIEVHRDTNTVSQILVNGLVVTNDLSTSVTQFKGLSVQKIRTDANTDTILVVLESSGLAVSMDVTSDLINVLVMVGDDAMKGHLRGLLGNYNGNPNDDFISRTGVHLSSDIDMEQIHFEFGLTWEVPENKTLFSNVIPQTSDFVPTFSDTNTLPVRNGTEEMCGDNVQCKFDFQVTGNEAIARSTANFIDKFNVLKKDLVKVIRCPFLDTPENGRRNITGYFPGADATFECLSGFVSVGGDHRQTCKEDGTWSGTTIACVQPVRPDDRGYSQEIILYTLGSSGIVVIITVIVIGIICQCRRRKPKEADVEEDAPRVDLHVLLSPSDIPRPIFENEEFLKMLGQLNSGDGFKIPRPSYVDPQLFDEYFF